MQQSPATFAVGVNIIIAMGQDNLTTFLAWWGAIVSTAVLAWDVYKWLKTGHPKLVVSANGNFVLVQSNSSQKYIVVRITNNGDKPTTLSLITYRFYKTKPSTKHKQHPDERGFFSEAIGTTVQLPHKLDVGDQWSGMYLQTAKLEKMAKEGFFYIEAEDSSKASAFKFARTRLLLD